MSRRGNCIDNAVLERWNKTLKAELGERFESPADAKTKLFDYIEVFYNQQRRHSTLGYLSPAAFERAAAGGVVQLSTKSGQLQQPASPRRDFCMARFLAS